MYELLDFLQNHVRSEAIRRQWRFKYIFFVFSFTLATLKIIFKIFDSIEFLKWNRDVKNCFKWTRFWKYIQIAHSTNNKNNNLCCIVFKQVVKRDLYHDIENFIIVKNVWNKIVEICEFTSFNAFIITYYKWEILKAENCVSINKYEIKFRNIISELSLYSFNFKMKSNWLIFKYFLSLRNSDHAWLFSERWIIDYFSFNNAIKIDFKFDINDIIYVYEVFCFNSMNRAYINDKSVAFFIIELIVIDFKIEKLVQLNANDQHNKIVIQIVK